VGRVPARAAVFLYAAFVGFLFVFIFVGLCCVGLG
jgi:hypothetical protein